ncbi:hypothetical protein Agau_C102377 [Agrobacterium tumefaciens F2]|nr:hypothetical protein Agau_C102377 [Agrobacterium tumefaciens F2]
MQDAAEWSEELDALRFAVPGHGAFCAVHRLAFKAVLGASPERGRRSLSSTSTKPLLRLRHSPR